MHPTLHQTNDGIDTLNELPVPVILFDENKIFFTNKTARKLLGYQSLTTKISDTCAISKHIDTKSSFGFLAYCKSVINNRSPYKTHIDLITCSRKKVTSEFILSPLINNKKRVILAVINPVKIDEFTNQVSKKEKSVFFSIKLKPTVQVKYISQHIDSVLDCTRDEIYNNPKILNDLSSVNTVKETFIKSISNDIIQTTAQVKIFRYAAKNGGEKYIQVSARLVNGTKNNEIEIEGFLTDVTNRERDYVNLIDTKQKFDILTHNSNDIIAFYTYFPKEKYLYISPGTFKILGYNASEILKDPKFFSKRILENQNDFVKEENELKKNQKKGILKQKRLTFKMARKNGEEIWLENNLTPVTNPQGKISFYINALHDVTPQKENDINMKLQNDNYSKILDYSPVAYFIHDRGVCLYSNKALMNLFKIKNKSALIGKFIPDLFPVEVRKKAIDNIADIYKSGKSKKWVRTHYKVADFKGSLLEVENLSKIIRYNNKDCVLTLVNNLGEKMQREREKKKMISVEAANQFLHKEIKEKQRVEKELIEKTAHLSSILESSTHQVWTVDEEFKVVSFNKNYKQEIKNIYGISIKTGQQIHKHLKRNAAVYYDLWYPRYRAAFEGRKQEFETEYTVHGKTLYRKVFIDPIYNDKKLITELSCIAHDITDSKIYEQKLVNQTAKLTAIFDSSHHYIWTIDAHERLTSFNKNYYDLVTALYNTKPYVGLVLDRGVLANDMEYTTLLKHHYNRAFYGEATSFEIETRDQDLKNVYLEIFLNPIYENGKVVEVSGIAHNITEKKHVQQRMEVSLKEKEILLREVHHRVKNNMQVISSILNLQSSYVSDEYALTLLKESQNRIKTMAYIHESLYQNKSFTSVNFSDYVKTLVNNIVQTYSYSADKIQLELNIEPIMLSLDSSIPAGLIINELITNAIKHAFPLGRPGLITFNLRCQNNFVILELKDNGVGFAEGVDFENSHSLGLQLVNTLTEQIEGQIKFKSGKNIGTEVIVTFKM